MSLLKNYPKTQIKKTIKKIFKSLKDLNKEAEEGDKNVRYAAIGASSVAAILAAAATATLLPGNRELDQEEVRPDYAAVQGQPNPDPHDPRADSVSCTYREGANRRET